MAEPSSQSRHHDCFLHFEPWRGTVNSGYEVNFLGALWKEEYYKPEISPERFVQTEYPPFDEEYFEWIDLLQAVIDSNSEFKIMELGAGYGRWSVNGALAATHVGKDYQVIAVEPEPLHFSWLKQSLSTNRLDPSRSRLVQAATGSRSGTAKFYVGNSQLWYGQSITKPWAPAFAWRFRRGCNYAAVRSQRVNCVSVASLIGSEDRIDLMDLDIQGFELRALKPAKTALGNHVRRIHIGTHSRRIESGLRRLFREMGWTAIFDFSCNATCQTEYGPINFQDGVQTWANPNL